MSAMKPKLRPGAALVEIDDEAVLYEPTVDQIHFLSPTATLLIQLCDGTATVKRTASEMAEAYGVDAKRVEADMRRLIRQFRKQKVLIAAGTAEEREAEEAAGRAADKREQVRMQVPSSS
jgi:type II secretory pathway component HofQ